MSVECGICCELLQSNDALLATPCGHVFHVLCLRPWFLRSQSCPQCRCYTTDANTRPLYLNFAADDPTAMRTLESRIVALQHMVDAQDAEIQSHNMHARTNATEINRLQMIVTDLDSKLQSKTEDAEVTLEWLKVREEKIRHLEDSARADKETFEVEIQRQRSQDEKLIKDLRAKCAALETSKRQLEVDLEIGEYRSSEVQKQQDKLIEELTAKCSTLEKSKRKLKSDLEKRVKEISILQISRTIKEVPMSCTELVSEERENEVAIQEARAVQEEPMPLTEIKSEQRENKIAAVSEARAVKEEAVFATGPSPKLKRASRKALSVIDSNEDTQAARRKQGHLKRPR